MNIVLLLKPKVLILYHHLSIKCFTKKFKIKKVSMNS